MGTIRSLAFGLLLLVFVATAAAANVGFWALNSVLDTEAFTATADRVVLDPAVRLYLADAIATRAVGLVTGQLGSVPSALKAQLALPTTATPKDVATALSGVVQRALLDRRAQAILDSAVRGLHASITQPGGRAAPLSVASDDVVLDLDQVISLVDQQLVPQQPGLFGVPIPADLGRIPIFHSTGLSVVVRAAELARTARWLLPAIALVAALLVLVVARHRVAALAWIGVSLLIVGLLCFGLVTVAAPFVAGALSPGPARSAIASSVTAFASGLASQSAIVALAGLVLVLLGAFGGRGSARDHALSFA
jgi:hypothetical protein